MRRLFLCTALVLTCVAGGRAEAGDRQTAQQIASQLEASGAMQGFDIGVKFESGTAFLRGTVRDQRQMAQAVAIARQQPNVRRVVNNLSVQQRSASPGRRPVVRSSHAAPVRRVQHMDGYDAGNCVVPDGSYGGGYDGYDGMVEDGGMISGNQGPLPAYVPGTGGGIAPARYDNARLPGYAWPSYAAYPNYAALTYPKQYSPTAWPFIGPFYPYPQVPLGWRKVTLEWDDGWWMLDFKDCPWK